MKIESSREPSMMEDHLKSPQESKKKLHRTFSRGAVAAVLSRSEYSVAILMVVAVATPEHENMTSRGQHVAFTPGDRQAYSSGLLVTDRCS